MHRIACLGGSTTAGVRTTRGYPEHLPFMLAGLIGRQTRPLVFNRGIPGGKLLDVLRQLPAELGLLKPSVVVMGLPLHDAQGGGVPPRELEALLTLLVDQVKAVGAQLVLCTPTPILGGSVRGFGRPSRRWVEKAAQVAQQVAACHDLPLVEWHQMDAGLLADGVHPTPQGCVWQAQQVAQVLAPLLPGWPSGACSWA